MFGRIIVGVWGRVVILAIKDQWLKLTAGPSTLALGLYGGAVGAVISIIVLPGWIGAAVAIGSALSGIYILHRTLRSFEVFSNTVLGFADTKAATSDEDSGADVFIDVARSLALFKSNLANLQKANSDIQRLNYCFEKALNSMLRGFSMFDAQGKLVVCNRKYLELYGLPLSLGQPGTTLAEIANHWCGKQRSSQPCDRAAIEAWFGTLNSKIGASEAFSELHVLDDGRVVRVQIQPLEEGGWIDLHEDVTEKQEVLQRITQLASFDTLTGLANRHQFLERLGKAISNLNEQGEEDHAASLKSRFAVLWLDLDKFKDVNDTLGHGAGDDLLTIVADRLRSAVRIGDLVARLGGDEFAILLEQTAADNLLPNKVAERVIDRVCQPVVLADQVVNVGVSIGIAFAPDHGCTTEEFLRNADMALYQAKSSGRGTAVVYNSDMEQNVRSRKLLESDLRKAVENGEFSLHYQPIVDLVTRTVTSCEALMRWQSPSRGWVSPAEFIPIAEDIGLIGKLGEWAIARACADASQWPKSIKVAVNISANQFAGRNLVAATQRALHANGFDASRLEFEVTESLMLQDSSATHAILSAIRAMGVSVALDDFGTGYASLSYLRSFPFDKLKIDQVFIRDLTERPECEAIVKAVIDLARSLRMRSVAEGVETIEHLKQIEAAGCDLAQGYYFSKPVPADQFLNAIVKCEVQLGLAA